jgi:hypothetical protein
MQGVTEVPAGERVEEEEMPEGPTTGKYEEWAYVSAPNKPALAGVHRL